MFRSKGIGAGPKGGRSTRDRVAFGKEGVTLLQTEEHMGREIHWEQGMSHPRLLRDTKERSLLSLLALATGMTTDIYPSGSSIPYTYP